MKLFAVAIAITGDNPDVVKLSCTTSFVEGEGHPKAQVIKAHSFKDVVNFKSERQVVAAFIKIASAVSYAVLNQMYSFDKVENNFCPVSLVIGKEAGREYNIDALNNILFCPPEELLSDKGFVEAHRKISSALNYCVMDFGNYFRHHNVSEEQVAAFMVNIEAGKNALNNRLIGLKKELDGGSTEALLELMRIADSRASDFARIYAMNENRHGPCWESEFRSEIAPWKDYYKRSDLQEKCPIFSFTTWHPAIHQMFVESLTARMGLTANLYLKSGAEAPSPYYCDVTNAMMWDQIDIMNGDKTPDDIKHKDHKEWRDEISSASQLIGSLGR